MTKLSRLIRDAKESAESRGHKLSRFAHFVPTWEGSSAAWAECLSCDAWVQVETYPAPNSIDISGSAVAIGCGVMS